MSDTSGPQPPDHPPSADRPPDYGPADVESALARVRLACLDLPEATERLSHGGPAFFVRGKKTFVMFLDDHHGDGRLAVWCAAPDGVQAELVETDPDRFFRPPYVGHRGWLGVQLLEVDQGELDAIALEAYRTVAPPALLAQLDERVPGLSGATSAELQPGQSTRAG